MFVLQWVSVNRDSDKGDFRLIGIEVGKPFTTYITVLKIFRIVGVFG